MFVHGVKTDENLRNKKCTVTMVTDELQLPYLAILQVMGGESRTYRCPRGFPGLYGRRAKPIGHTRLEILEDTCMSDFRSP
jgi:hypothetical protein